MRLTIGIVSYNDFEDLKNLIDIFKNQTYKNFELAVFDASLSEETKELVLSNNFYYLTKLPEINIGFGNAHNSILKYFYSNNNNFGYHVILNTDLILENNFLENILKILNNNKYIDVLCPTIYKVSDLKNINKNEIDANGIILKKNLNCYNNKKKILSLQEVFGFTGAAVVFNMFNLKDLFDLNESMYDDKYNFFDPLFFMYKEDIDLSMRFRLFGKKIYISPDIIVYHRRTLADTYYYQKNIFVKIIRFFEEKRKTKKHLRYWSFLNHRIYFLKYISFNLDFKIFLNTLIFEILSFFYALFNPFLLRSYVFLWQKRNILYKYFRFKKYYDYNLIKNWIEK